MMNKCKLYTTNEPVRTRKVIIVEMMDDISKDLERIQEKLEYNPDNRGLWLALSKNVHKIEQLKEELGELTR
jgi:hypothetical protein